MIENESSKTSIRCPRPINVATDHSAEWCKKNGHCGCVELEVLRKEYGEAVYPINKNNE